MTDQVWVGVLLPWDFAMARLWLASPNFNLDIVGNGDKAKRRER